MVEFVLTVRDLVSDVNWDVLKPYLLEIEGISCDNKADTLVAQYQKFLNELLEMEKVSTPSSEPTALVISLVKAGDDTFNDEDYLDVALKNYRFVEDPEQGLSPWGGKAEDKNDCPDGYYNCNWFGYQRLYGVTGTNLISLLSATIFLADEETQKFINANYALLLAAILKEMSFTGFSHSEREEFVNELKRRFEKLENGTAELFTLDEVRQKLLDSEPTVIQYENPLKKYESKRKG